MMMMMMMMMMRCLSWLRFRAKPTHLPYIYIYIVYTCIDHGESSHVHHFYGGRGILSITFKDVPKYVRKLARVRVLIVCTCLYLHGGVFDISKKQNMSNKNQKLGHFKRVLLEFLKLLDLYFMYPTQVPRLVSKNAEAWGRKGGAGRSGLQEISIWSLFDLIFLSGLQYNLIYSSLFSYKIDLIDTAIFEKNWRNRCRQWGLMLTRLPCCALKKRVSWFTCFVVLTGTLIGKCTKDFTKDFTLW